MESPELEPSTAGLEYTNRLNRLGSKRWKQWLNVQAPYRWNIRRVLSGRTLDVGCGTGRVLSALSPESLGVDHNPHSVQFCRDQGLTAYTVDDFFADKSLSAPESFDSLIAAHLVEHLEPADARDILASYLPMLRPGGTVLLITPQERGYASDATHVTFTDFAKLDHLTTDLGLEKVRHFSFPFPRVVGKVFLYNEFNHVSRQPLA
jgi:2-polyprenyl-3-methyl-5-hydroxy-6-metoxy-1,4-benzoquinol methylase